MSLNKVIGIEETIFPLDVNGSARIDGDLILAGRFFDSAGKCNPTVVVVVYQVYQNKAGKMNHLWSNATLKTAFDGNVGIGTTSPRTILQIKGIGDSNNVQLLIENESYVKGIQFQYKSVTGTTYDFPQAKIWTSEASAYDTKLNFSKQKVLVIRILYYLLL